MWIPCGGNEGAEAGGFGEDRANRSQIMQCLAGHVKDFGLLSLG